MLRNLDTHLPKIMLRDFSSRPLARQALFPFSFAFSICFSDSNWPLCAIPHVPAKFSSPSVLPPARQDVLMSMARCEVFSSINRQFQGNFIEDSTLTFGARLCERCSDWRRHAIISPSLEGVISKIADLDVPPILRLPFVAAAHDHPSSQDLHLHEKNRCFEKDTSYYQRCNPKIHSLRF